MADPVDLNFEVVDEHLQLWERQDWRYASLMGGRGNGRSGTASRFVVSQLPGEEYPSRITSIGEGPSLGAAPARNRSPVFRTTTD
jgi:hypothetical protein